MRRILKSVSLVITFALASALSVAPANATTQFPIINTPSGATVMVNNLTFSYTLPEAPLAGSVRVTLSRTSPASPAVTRTYIMGNSQSVSLNINPFASNLDTIDQSAGAITAIESPSDVVQVGTYAISVRYQDAAGSPAATASVQNITLTAPCSVGNYSTDGNVPVGSDCIQAPANSYVATTGATSATACPATYTSPAGSDASSDCIAPVVSQTPTVVAAPATKALPTLAKGKKMRIRTLATQIEMSLPARSKATAKVAKSSRNICRVSGNSIRALKKGSCVVTVKVKPRTGSATTKATTITVN